MTQILQYTVDSISYGSRYQPEMEPAQEMSLPQGCLIVFSRGLRHVTQDSRRAVLNLLPLLAPAPEIAPKPVGAVNVTVGSSDTGPTFW